MFRPKASQNMPPSSYMDPFNERANDSFFGQLPKHFDTSSSIAQYNSFYGGIAGQKGAWQAPLPSKKKPSKDRSKQKQKSKSTPSPYGGHRGEHSLRSHPIKEYDEESPSRSSSYTPKHLQELPVKTANSKWQSICHDADDDTSGTDALSWDSNESLNSGSKRRSQSSKHQVEDRKKLKGRSKDHGSRKDSSKKTEKKKDRSYDYDLPPAFQTMAKLDKKKKKKAQSLAKKTKGSSIKQDAVKETERARSKDRKKEREHSISKRERSLSLSRLRSKKEELRARKQSEKSTEQEEKLSNPLPSMGYKGRLKERDNVPGSPRGHESSRRRGGSAGRLHKEVTKHRSDKNKSTDTGEGEMMLAPPSASSACRRSREPRSETQTLEQPKRSNSLGAMHTKTKDRSGRDRSRVTASSREQRPTRSNSVGALHKKTKQLPSRDLNESTVASKTVRERKPRRSNSLGALHKKSRSIRDSEDTGSIAPKGRHQPERHRSTSRDEASAMVGASMTPNTKARKRVASKPTASSMDGIFAAPISVKPTKEGEPTSPTPINAVQGNKAALAAWKTREAAKEEGTPVRIRSKASIAAAYEAAAGISPRRPSREDLLQIPSLFTSPPLVAKKKVRVKSSSPKSKSKTTRDHQSGKDAGKKILPPGYRGVSCRPQRK